jgi:Kef-type K+ transport system membrane component KefB
MTIPFFHFDGLFDNSWLSFLLIAALSRISGKNVLFKKLGIPFITGYMIIGFLCGPYVLEVISVKQVGELGYVNKLALSFIAFSAGAEMDMHEIRPLLNPIMCTSFGMVVFTLLFGILFTYYVAGTSIMPWGGGYSSSCVISISTLVACILSARSPTSVLAVVRELQAKGPVTSLMIAITVGGDILVLTLFAIFIGLAQPTCAGKPFDFPTFIIDLVLILAAFVWGIALGGFLMFIFKYPVLRHLTLPTGFFTYLVTDYVEEQSAHNTKYSLIFDTLLICIAAGFIMANYSPHHYDFLRYLKEWSKFVFIPFFTLVGLSINLPVLISSLGFAFLAVLVRIISMFLGTLLGGKAAKLDTQMSGMLWIGLLPQAGVSLGLATIVADLFKDSFGDSFQSTVIAIIIINQVIGPFGAKFLIKFFDEHHRGADEENDIHPWLVDEIDVQHFEAQTQTDSDDLMLDDGVPHEITRPRGMSNLSETATRKRGFSNVSESASNGLEMLAVTITGIVPLTKSGRRKSPSDAVPPLTSDYNELSLGNQELIEEEEIYSKSL